MRMRKRPGHTPWPATMPASPLIPVLAGGIVVAAGESIVAQVVPPPDPA